MNILTKSKFNLEAIALSLIWRKRVIALNMLYDACYNYIILCVPNMELFHFIKR